ncbi:hypothetical protein [Alkalitalea saponilacus]|uniref:Uncharacterized protein n=1 Tax=Alkalitalea saponilacus TaxID=889453 RepID=A0A1T5HUM8_9BACT|nr:hypothetical protein [Alkalitalea saponilacus]ASB50350.1 hypothetical protein CDL62_14960 [Alkalitalea saponilacus]SKC24271.1 hypothetical protein SAMN03080601_03568 [Alkalitalea saponilacus]
MSIYGQHDELYKVVEEYCTKTKQIDWNAANQSNVYSKINQIALEVNTQNTDNIIQAKERIKKENPQYSNEEVERQFSSLFIINLVENCPEYLMATRKLLEECPPKNLTLIMILNKTNEIIEKHSNKNYFDQIKAIDNELYPFVYDNMNTVIKDYPNGLNDPNFINDFSRFILHRSDGYFKAYMITTSINVEK